MLGNAFGVLAQLALPHLVSGPTAYALVGMGALLAGTTHAPLTAALMVFEMTLDYRLVVPLLLASAVASVVATAHAKESGYTEAQQQKRSAGEAGRVTTALAAGDVLRKEQITVPPDLSLAELLDRFVSARRNHLYVVAADGRFGGAVNLHDVNRLLREGASAARAEDLARTDFEVTTPGEPLERVLERFAKLAAERLPVVDSAESRRLVGTVSKRDILAVYSRDLIQRGSRVKARDLDAPVGHLMDDVGVPPDLVGSSFEHARFAERWGATLLMIRRGRSWLVPDAATRFADGDRLIVFGPPERVEILRRAGG
jgi:CIC family chloride channel protein